MSYSVLTLIRRRFPWLLDTAVGTTPTMSGAIHHLFTTEHLFGHRIGLRSTLESPKLLLSPCDPDREGANDLVDFTKFSHHVVVPNEAHSYGLAVGKDSPRDKGADASKPQTILVMTRNIMGPQEDGESLSNQPPGNLPRPNVSAFVKWLGADTDGTNARVMAGLNSNQGQLGLSDGSVSKSNNADLEESVKAHHSGLGGLYKGVASAIIDTPND